MRWKFVGGLAMLRRLSYVFWIGDDYLANTQSILLSQSKECRHMCVHTSHQIRDHPRLMRLMDHDFPLPFLGNNMSHLRHGLCFRRQLSQGPLISQLPFGSKRWPCSRLRFWQSRQSSYGRLQIFMTAVTAAVLSRSGLFQGST